MIKFVHQNREIKAFREGIIKHIARRETEHKAFSRWISQFDDYCEDYYIQKPVAEIKIKENEVIESKEKQNETNGVEQAN